MRLAASLPRRGVLALAALTLASPAAAAAGTADAALPAVAGAGLPLLWGLPFAGLLLSIALVPLVSAHFWHAHYGKVAAAWVLAFLLPFTLVFGLTATIHDLAHAILLEYVPFVAILFALFTIAGGICLRGTLIGTPSRQHRHPGAGRRAGERHGDDGRGDAADPPAPDRQRKSAAQGTCGRVLHHSGRQRRRRALAARRSSALHRLPQGRRLLLDDARARVADGIARRSLACRVSGCSTPGFIARNRRAPSLPWPDHASRSKDRSTFC